MAHRVVALVLTVLCVAFATAANAAESALMAPIGYSQNLRYFAFEEFGIADGSGLAYSNIYMIEINEDRWVVGTPVRIVADSEDQTLAAIRARAQDEAGPRLRNLKIDVPAHELASNGDGVLDNNGKSLVFAFPLPGFPGSFAGRYELSLEQYPTSSGSPCEDWFGEKANGFVLSLSDYAPKREVHRDEMLPRSRGCPVEYRIQSVFVPFEATDDASSVALISVYSHGFEGLDRRFIVVALAKNQVGL